MKLFRSGLKHGWKTLVKIPFQLQFWVIFLTFFMVELVKCGQVRETYDYKHQTSIQNVGKVEVGKWYWTESCPNNSIVTGFDLKYVPYQGTAGSVGHVFAHIFTLGISYAVARGQNIFDDSGVLAIYLDCTDIRTKEHVKWIQGESSTGECPGGCETRHKEEKILGNLKGKNPDLSCPGRRPAIGFQIKNEKLEGSAGDFFGTVNFKLVCSGPHKYLIDPDIDYESVNPHWSDPIMCPENSAVCGIQPKVLPHKPNIDNAGLTDVRLQCCPAKLVESIDLDCTPQVLNKSVSYSKNCNDKPLSLQVQLLNKQTTTKENARTDSVSKGGFSTTTFGLTTTLERDLGAVKAELEAKFETTLGKHWNSELENQLRNVDEKGEETQQTLMFEIPPMHSGHVDQLVFQCGNTVAATKSLHVRTRPLTERDCRKRRNFNHF